MDSNYSKLLDIAYKMHVSGQLDAAKDVYEKLIVLKPDDLDVQNLYAQLCIAIKDYDTALKLFSNVYEKTNLYDVAVNLGKVYYFKEDFNKSIDILSKLEKLEIKDQKFLAIIYVKTQQYQCAIDLYTKILASQNMDPSDYYNLSFAYKNIDDTENALKYALLAEQPNETDINLLFKIAIMYMDLKNNNKAIEYFDKIVILEPDNKFALINLAQLYRNISRHISTQIMIELEQKFPDDEYILNNLFILYNDTAMYEDAYKIANKLLNMFPENSYYYSIIGSTLQNLYRYEEALNIYEQALSKDFENSDYILSRYAFLLEILGNIEEANKIYEENKDNELFSVGYMFFKLKEKNLADVKELFFEHVNSNDPNLQKRIRDVFYKYKLDKRYCIDEESFLNLKNTADAKKQQRPKEKLWINQDIKSKRLLIYSKHGVGDLFMFCRFIEQLKPLVSELILQVPNSCLDFISYNFPYAKVYSTKDYIEDDSYDYYTTFYGLLYNIDVDLKTIKQEVPYFSVSEDLVEEKSKNPVFDNNKTKIGIYWQGNPAVYQNRSAKLINFLELYMLKSVQLYSFQISDIDLESEKLKKELDIIDLAPFIKNYSDTAAFLKNIDILVTIDTSIAHLAGAMGVKVYLILPYNSEWRWFNDNETTPWYNNIKIFKQTKPNDWDEVIKRVKNECTLQGIS